MGIARALRRRSRCRSLLALHGRRTAPAPVHQEHPARAATLDSLQPAQRHAEPPTGRQHRPDAGPAALRTPRRVRQPHRRLLHRSRRRLQPRRHQRRNHPAIQSRSTPPALNRSAERLQELRRRMRNDSRHRLDRRRCGDAEGAPPGAEPARRDHLRRDGSDRRRRRLDDRSALERRRLPRRLSMSEPSGDQARVDARGYGRWRIPQAVCLVV